MPFRRRIRRILRHYASYGADMPRQRDAIIDAVTPCHASIIRAPIITLRYYDDTLREHIAERHATICRYAIAYAYILRTSPRRYYASIYAAAEFRAIIVTHDMSIIT